jgi:delta 1-pyrroline-5-carboxylate dehydrogenase
MRTSVHVLVVASLCLGSAGVAARPHDIQPAVVLLAAVFPAQKASSVKAPDTPAGRALTEFVDSFNAGGKTRQTWLETRTTIEGEARANILRMDAQLLQEYGALSIARIASSAQGMVAAVVRHGTSDRHGYLTISVEPAAPHKVVNMVLRAARPDEIKDGVKASANLNGKWDGYLRSHRAGRPGRP